MSLLRYDTSRHESKIIIFTNHYRVYRGGYLCLPYVETSIFETSSSIPLRLLSISDFLVLINTSRDYTATQRYHATRMTVFDGHYALLEILIVLLNL